MLLRIEQPSIGIQLQIIFDDSVSSTQYVSANTGNFGQQFVSTFQYGLGVYLKKH